MAKKFPDDFLNGTHPSVGLVAATFLAQLVVKDFDLTEEEIYDSQIRVLASVQGWLGSNYPSKYVDIEGWDLGFAVDVDYWSSVINGIDDVVDALMFLRHLSESNWKALVEELGEPRVYLALLFLALDHASSLTNERPCTLLTQYSYMAHKCVTELVLVENGPFVGSSFHNYEMAILKSAAFSLADEEKQNSRSDVSRSGGNARGDKYAQLRNEAVRLFNELEPRPQDMISGAELILEEWLEFDRINAALIKPTARQKLGSLKRQLSIANSQGQLFKKFARS